MGRRHEEVGQEVAVARAHAETALAAPPLRPVLGDRGPLDVAGVAHGDGHVLFRDQVLDAQLARVVHDLGAPFVAVLVPHLPQLVDHDVHQQRLAAEDLAQAPDDLQQLGQLVEHLLPLEPGQALELHVEDGLGLDAAQLEPLDEPLAGLGGAAGAPDEGDHRVEVVEGDLQPLEDVGAGLRLAQLVLGAPADDVVPERDEPLDEIEQAEDAGASVDDGQHDHAERGLQRRVLVQVVQDDFGDLAALQLDDDPHAAAVRLVAEVADALDGLAAHQLRDLLDQPGLVELVGDLGDDDRLPIALSDVLDRGAAPHRQRAAPGLVGGVDARVPDDEPAGGEVGPADAGAQAAALVGLAVPAVLDGPHDAVDDLPQVVGRDVGGHAHRDARRAVHEEVRVRGREDRGLLGGLVVVGDEVDRLLVEIRHQVVGDRLQPRLGVPHRGRGVAVYGAEVPLAVDQGVAHVELLGEPHQGVVDGRVAVGMEVPHDLADDLGALPVGPVRGQPHQPHAVHDPPVGRLQPVAHVGQGAPDDDAHGVVHVRAPHLVFDVDGRSGV